MTYTTIQFWETALDVTGLLMCVMTLVYIVRIRMSGRGLSGKPDPDDFKEEMRAQSAGQGPGAALESIARALDRERKNLQLCMGTGLQPAFAGTTPGIDRSRALPDRETPVYRAYGNPIRKSGIYSETIELSACGMSVRQIADKVQLPRGEVELSIKLRNRRK